MKIQKIKIFMLAFLMLNMIGLQAQILKKAESQEVVEVQEDDVEVILEELEAYDKHEGHDHGDHEGHDHAKKAKDKKAKMRRAKGKANGGGLLPGEGFYMRDKRIEKALVVLEKRRAMGKISEEKYMTMKTKLQSAKKSMYKGNRGQIPPGHKKRMEKHEQERHNMEEGKRGKKALTEEQKAARKERMERFEAKRAERKAAKEKDPNWVDKRTDWQKEQAEKEGKMSKDKATQGKEKWKEMKGTKGGRIDMREEAMKERLENGEITKEEYAKRVEQMEKRKMKSTERQKARGMDKDRRKKMMKEKVSKSKMQRNENEAKLANLKKNLEERKAAGTITEKRYKSAMEQIEKVEKNMIKLKEKEAEAAKM